MQYGLIGEKLGHSFSAEIHQRLKSSPYTLVELSCDEIEAFFAAKDFSAINVTIPYKTTVIPYLSHIDESAKAIGAVNTVVNRGGELWGYNTDFYGLSALILHAGIALQNKKVAILGTGGTSKTALAVAKFLDAKEILVVSRQAGDGVITYDELTKLHTDVEVLINTTPVGMYPNAEISPIELSVFSNLSGVIDAIYNPLRTKLILEAKKRGIERLWLSASNDGKPVYIKCGFEVADWVMEQHI